MAKKKEGESFMPKLEIALIILFILGFLAWAISKCSNDAPKQEILDEQVDVPVVDTPVAQTPTDTVPVEETVPLLPSKRVPVLYATIDGLKMREQPNLKSDVILKLELFDEVEFLGEITSFQDTVNLGREVVASHWAYVRHIKGHSGWVFGAGIDYYKHKHEGTLE